jgi:isochorismate synthase
VDRAAVAALAATEKDRREHAVVVAGIRRILERHCVDVEVGTTDPVGLADLAHLATPIRAVATPATPSALGLAVALHPTAAVGGAPRDRALEHILRFEGDRGPYAAPVGWVDAAGDGEFAVAIRSAEIVGAQRRTAIVRAGAGIVAGSDPDREWDETETKLATVLRAFTPR